MQIDPMLFWNIILTEMATYRQALRDITNQSGFPFDVTFPTKPS